MWFAFSRYICGNKDQRGVLMDDPVTVKSVSEPVFSSFSKSGAAKPQGIFQIHAVEILLHIPF